MGKDRTITITTDIIANLKGMDKVVSQLKAGLSEKNTKIDFTRGAGASISKLVAKFKDEFSKFNQLTEGGKLNLLDSKEALKSGKNVIDTYKELQRIIGDFRSLGVLDAKKLFPDAFNSKADAARNSLKGVLSTYERLSTKELRLKQRKEELENLEKEANDLKNTLKDSNELKINTQKADNKVTKTTEKVEELKEKLEKDLTLKIVASDTNLKDLKKRKKELETKIKKSNVDITGRTPRYKEATYSEWKNRKNKAKDESPQQRIGAMRALNNYNDIKKELDEVNKGINTSEKNIRSYNKALTDLENNTSKNFGKNLENAGVSVDKIEEIKNATREATKAIEDQAEAQRKLNEVEDSSSKLSGYESKITQKKKDIEGLEQGIKLLKDKLDFSGIENAFKDLDIDITPEMLQNESGVKKLKDKLDELDQQDLAKLVRNLEELGLSTDEAKNYVEKLTGKMVELGNTASDINRADQEMEQLKNQVLQFFSIGNAVELFKRAVRSAVDTVKELDATMTETAVVTDFTISDMWNQLPAYAAEANKLGAAINDLYGSTTLYYQQGKFIKI